MDTRVTQFIKKFDFLFFLLMIVIFLIGISNLYSANHASTSESMRNLWKVQIMWFSVATFAGFIISIIASPKTLFRFSYPVYFLNLILLILVLLLGKKGMGAQRWLVLGPIRLQPSELMKISLTLALARYYARNYPDRELTIKTIIKPGILTLIPALLIMAQPDLGTGGLLVLIFLVMTFYRQIKWKSIGILAIAGLIIGTLGYNFALKEYQKKRIITFINPKADAKGSGYNAIQSEIAIGSGRITGKGYMKSTQASLQYLPENHTDFVFSIFNEEHGLFGSVILITLYIFLLMRFVWLSGSVLRFYDSLLAVGLMSIFFWHIIINMSMVMGLFPVVGLPLPFMSYGGSSLLTFGICIGMATSLSNSRTLF
jgi:rod shape determining protein RodA